MLRLVVGLLLFPFVLLAGCYRPLGYEYAGPDAGTDLAADLTLTPGCAALDQATCAARGECRVATCPGCDSSPLFAGCKDADDDEPVVCPALACPASCHDYTTLGSCKAAAAQGCQVFDCCGFAGCLDPGEQMTCTADCVPTCAALGEAQCNNAAWCHTVYNTCPPNALCGPDPSFNHCAEGAAQCSPIGVICDVAPEPCAPGYVHGISGGCYEGCVKQESCCAETCKSGERCEMCWTDYLCLSDDVAC